MRQQRLLHPIFAIDEPTHRPPPKPSSSGILKQIRSERNPIAPKSQAVFTQAGPILDEPSTPEICDRPIRGRLTRPDSKMAGEDPAMYNIPRVAGCGVFRRIRIAGGSGRTSAGSSRHASPVWYFLDAAE